MAYIEFKKVSFKGLKDLINIKINKNDFVVIKDHNNLFLIDLLQGHEVDKGSITVDKNNISNLSGIKLSKYIRKYLGVVFSHDDLLENLTLEENMMLASEISLKPGKVNKYLKKLGLTRIKNNYPDELSLYKNKLASIARVLIKNSPIILIYNIDEIFNKKEELLLNILSELKGTKTIIIATENKNIIELADMIITIGKTKITTKKSGDVS